jgi:branched-chain amino acid transport system permease protein
MNKYIQIALSGNRLIIILAAIAAIVAPLLVGEFLTMMLSQALIYAIAAMSLDLLIGYTGLASLGHAGFMAIGAYTAAILTTRYGVVFGVAVVSGIGMSAILAAILGCLALRASGVYFMMITLAIAMCIWGLIYRWVEMTGGDNGISGIMRPDFVLSLDEPANFYYLILICFLISFGLMKLLTMSPFGRSLVGTKDSVSRMRVLGFNVWLHHYLIFIIAGAFAGFSGALYAFYNGFVGPDVADLAHCMLLVLVVTIGGEGSLIGALVGALIVTALENLVSIYIDRWVMVLAAVYIITALYAPTGVLGLFRKSSYANNE